jgi:hypothetical protein
VAENGAAGIEIADDGALVGLLDGPKSVMVRTSWNHHPPATSASCPHRTAVSRRRRWRSRAAPRGCYVRWDFPASASKSSVEDLRADQKWQDYRMHCDRLFFAFTQDLPCEIFPEGTGLIIADAYGAHLHCEAPEHRLPAATRKSMTVRFAMAAAQRINRLIDPQGHGEF